MGYAPIKLYQYYKITSFEAWLTDIDYGTTYQAETKIWNIWMAPSKNTPYQAASTFGSNYIPTTCPVAFGKTLHLLQLVLKSIQQTAQVQIDKFST